MSVVVRVENVSKKYQLGKIGTQSLKGDLARWWARKRGSAGSLGTIGQENNGGNGEFWALKEVSFDIQQGEAIAIIGKNGAGKSTLLKILSRITLPTTGRLRVKGRIASLLEVGTGFNPDLTGRENVYLNGAILGMTKREVARKFDEIVDFSGVGKFIDTPVKRYSSGMYVRLAFSVAAHLDSEILILDEVLAVGDAEFQLKCLKKMNSVTREEGRTVIFVSHSMSAVQRLCSTAVLLEKGVLKQHGNLPSVIAQYNQQETNDRLEQSWNTPEEAPGNNYIKAKRFKVIPDYLDAQQRIDVRTPVRIRFEFWNLAADARLNISLHLLNAEGITVFNVGSTAKVVPAGMLESECLIPGNFLNDGLYVVRLMVVQDFNVVLFDQEDALRFEVHDYREVNWSGKWGGVIRPKLQFPLNVVKEYSPL